MPTVKRLPETDRAYRESHLAYHLCCLHEDATDPEIGTLERLALVRDRARRIREIRRDLDKTKSLERR
jgi:hypothetical protein